MTRRRLLWLVIIGLLVAPGAVAWYARPIAPARLVGVDWRITVKRSTCKTMWREVFCTTSWPAQPRRVNYTTLQINPLTRGVIRIAAMRAMADSASWSAALDSTRRAMEASRGDPVPCYTSETGFPVAEAWRFGRVEARMYAGAIQATRYRAAYWYVNVEAVPLGAYGCGRTFRYVFLSPSQIARQVQEWFADQIGF